ncbi:MAG: hypothetical protein LBU24_02080 [Methanocalculaceae archaeon]|jgi:hypothetical protein|nr:hypothetical protein [Methanocalculaceae archaeon]
MALTAAATFAFFIRRNIPTQKIASSKIGAAIISKNVAMTGAAPVAATLPGKISPAFLAGGKK